MCSPVTTTSPSTSSFHLDQDPHKRPFDPRATMILLGSLAIRSDASRIGYRPGYQDAQHIVRDAPKESILGSFAPTESPTASLSGMAKSVAQGLAHGVSNLAVRTVTGINRSLQGSSQGDLSRIREVFIRYVHYHCKTNEDKDFLKWALLGIHKIKDAYPGESGTLQVLSNIEQIGKNALMNSLPDERPIDFGADWTQNDISHFHEKLNLAFAALKAINDAEKAIQPGSAKDQKISLGEFWQSGIEDSLKAKADQYEKKVSLTLASQAAKWSTAKQTTSETASPQQQGITAAANSTGTRQQRGSVVSFA